jgi:hypothetical protein
LFLPSIQEFYFQFDYKPPSDESYSPAIVAKGDEDMFSSHLRVFSQQLTSLEITRAVLGQDLFWPLNTDKTLKAPFWPRITKVCAEHVPDTPSGEWLFQRVPKDPDDFESDDDVSFDKAPSWPRYVQISAEDRKSRIFRRRIIGNFANELYGSAGLAALQMPKLKDMQLETTGGEHTIGSTTR